MIESAGLAHPLGQKIRNMGRFTHIAKVFARYGFFSVMEMIGVHKWMSDEQIKEVEGSRGEEKDGDAHSANLDIEKVAHRLRCAFEDLGPAFIKLGQVLATREDLFSKVFIDEFKKLHSQVRPISFEEVKKVLDTELPESKRKLIVSVDEEPLAAGSIGQVHKAQLANGQSIVLKIQRPGIAPIIEVDLALMDTMAALIEKYFPDLRKSRPRMIVEEFSRATLSELDFVREAGATTKIAHNFAGDPKIVIPEVHWDLSTRRVLALEFVEGFAVENRKQLEDLGININNLLEHGLEIFMQMVFVDGYFHGDLHPGNLIAVNGDRVGVIDFGVAVKISRTTRERLAGLLLAFVEEDYDNLVNHFIEMTNMRPEFDIEAFEHEVTNSLSPFIGLKLQEMRTGALLWDIGRIAAKHGAPMPRELVVFLRTLVAFEGVGSSLNPDFDMMSTCQKFTKRITDDMYSVDNLKRQGLMIGRDFTNLARYAPRQFRSIIRALIDGELRFNVNSEDWAAVASAMDRASSRLAVSLIIGALLISSSILIFSKAGETYKDFSLLGLVGFALAGLLGFYVIFSIMFSRRKRF